MGVAFDPGNFLNTYRQLHWSVQIWQAGCSVTARLRNPWGAPSLLVLCEPPRLRPVPKWLQGKEAVMCPRTEVIEMKVYRLEKKRDVRCRLTYEVTPFRDGLMRWFLVGIEELE